MLTGSWRRELLLFQLALKASSGRVVHFATFAVAVGGVRRECCVSIRDNVFPLPPLPLSSSQFLQWQTTRCSDWQLQSFYCVCLSGSKCDWHSAHWMGRGRGKGQEIKQKTKSSLHDNYPASSAIFTPPPPPPPPLLLFLFSILFHHRSIPVIPFLFFPSTKIRFDSKSPQARQMTDNPSQFYH